jgi:Uma2 family endonuclease
MYTIYNNEEARIEEVEEPDHSLTYTYADYYSWNFMERLELLRGKIFQLGAANTKHQRVGGKLYNEFYNFLKGKTCQVFIAPYDVRLPVKDRKRDDQITTVVQPDLCIFCNPDAIDERGACGIPDLVVEILSPGNPRHDLLEKYDVYQEVGVKEYWIIDPIKEMVMVSIMQKQGKFAPTKIITDNQLLEPLCIPGFYISAKELFTR